MRGGAQVPKGEERPGEEAGPRGTPASSMSVAAALRRTPLLLLPARPPSSFLPSFRRTHTLGRRASSWSHVVACRRAIGACGSVWHSRAGGISLATMAPVTLGDGPAGTVEQHIRENKVMVFSKSYCPFCHKVREGRGGKRRNYCVFGRVEGNYCVFARGG